VSRDRLILPAWPRDEAHRARQLIQRLPLDAIVTVRVTLGAQLDKAGSRDGAKA
jgi:hypothetical protein